jgi:hypothetical protein
VFRSRAYRAGLRAVADVSASAELAGEVADVDDPYGVAVFLSEQGGRAGGFGLGSGGVPDPDLGVVEEASGVDEGALLSGLLGLLGVGAEGGAQHGVRDVGR